MNIESFVQSSAISLPSVLCLFSLHFIAYSHTNKIERCHEYKTLKRALKCCLLKFLCWLEWKRQESDLCSWAFVVTKFNEVFLGYQPHQMSVLNWCFKNHLTPPPHHHGSEMVLEASVQYRHLTWLIAREDFINEERFPHCHILTIACCFSSFSELLPICLRTSCIWIGR